MNAPSERPKTAMPSSCSVPFSSQENAPKNSNQKRSSLKGSDQVQITEFKRILRRRMREALGYILRDMACASSEIWTALI
ncbi:hypothetical protein IE4803_PB00478 (plasmid) [Rhizobium etli bv. phaseoli str. IE4803]|nr:hypothetical protein IE4803_PB00478 [Rhizobium etli bv. phaseoli str. IE4803]